MKQQTPTLATLEAERNASVPNTARRKWTDSDIVFLLSHTEYTPAQMAAHFGIKPGTMRKFISEGKLSGRLPKSFHLTPDTLGPAPKPKPKPPKLPKQKAKKPKPAPKPVKKKPSTAPRFTTNTKKVEKKFETLTDRDAGKVMVKVDSRTWKMVTPEKAQQYLKTA